MCCCTIDQIFYMTSSSRGKFDFKIENSFKKAIFLEDCDNSEKHPIFIILRYYQKLGGKMCQKELQKTDIFSKFCQKLLFKRMPISKYCSTIMFSTQIMSLNRYRTFYERFKLFEPYLWKLGGKKYSEMVIYWSLLVLLIVLLPRKPSNHS